MNSQTKVKSLTITAILAVTAMLIGWWETMRIARLRLQALSVSLED